MKEIINIRKFKKYEYKRKIYYISKLRPIGFNYFSSLY